MTQQALRELVRLHDEMGAHSHGDESPDEIHARYQAWVHACYEAMPVIKALLGEQREVQGVVDMLLYCPKCGRQHIDAAGPDPEWTNPPHRSHKCRFPDCGHVWRPADVATNGVLALDTVGLHDGSPNPKDFTPPLAESVGDLQKADELAQKILNLLDGYNLEYLDKERVRLFCYQSRHMQQGNALDGYVLVKAGLLRETVELLVSQPEKWLLVPKVPTPEMLLEGDEVIPAHEPADSGQVYAAMIAAAPYKE